MTVKLEEKVLECDKRDVRFHSRAPNYNHLNSFLFNYQTHLYSESFLMLDSSKNKLKLEAKAYSLANRKLYNFYIEMKFSHKSYPISC